MLAFTFANPWMLGWLAAAAIPWLIHWFFRGRPREQSWAAMDILLAALKRRARRLRHQEWLLMGLRTVLIASAAVAAAGPIWDDSAVEAVSRGPRHHVLVLDATYSMSCVENGRDRFAAAKHAAAQIVDRSGPEDSFSLVVMPDPPNGGTAGMMISRTEIKRRLSSVPIAHNPANLEQTLNQVRLAIGRYRETTRNPTAADVYWLTDLGAYTWSRIQTSAVTERAAGLRETARCWVVDVGQPAAANAFVLPPRLLRLATTNAPVDVEIKVGSHGGFPAEAANLELFSDDKRLAVARLEGDGPSERTTRMSCLISEPGDYVVRAHLQSDRLSLDNDAWRVVRVRDQIRVLCVDGGSGEDTETGFVRAALESQEENAPTPFVIFHVLSTDIDSTDFEPYDCVMFCDVSSLATAVKKRLASYVRNGGAAMFFLGGRVNAASDRGQNSTDRTDPLALFPAIPMGVAPLGNYAFDPLGYRHPLLDIFRGRDGAGLLTTPIFKYHKLEFIPDSQARIALAFDTGDPAIVEKSLGSGRVIVVALPPSIPTSPAGADATFSMWPAWPSFLPLVHEMVKFCLQGADREIEVGQPWLGNLPASSSTSRIAVTAPDGQRNIVPVEYDGETPTWRFGATWLAGPYEARDADSDALIERFAVRLNNDEGDLGRISTSDLPADWQAFSVLQALPSSGSSEPRETSGVHTVLALLAVLMVAESIATGRGRRGVA